MTFATPTRGFFKSTCHHRLEPQAAYTRRAAVAPWTCTIPTGSTLEEPGVPTMWYRKEEEEGTHASLITVIATPALCLL